LATSRTISRSRRVSGDGAAALPPALTERTMAAALRVSNTLSPRWTARMPRTSGPASIQVSRQVGIQGLQQRRSLGQRPEQLDQPLGDLRGLDQHGLQQQVFQPVDPRRPASCHCQLEHVTSFLDRGGQLGPGQPPCGRSGDPPADHRLQSVQDRQGRCIVRSASRTGEHHHHITVGQQSQGVV
jgi:hypothetical protein